MKTIREMREYLRGIGSTYSFPSKDRYVERIEHIRKYLTFPWREDQRQVLESFMGKEDYKYYVINGIFGCGKTTLLFGILINSFIEKVHLPTECMFISFNVSIKNELKRKLKLYGFSSKVEISTFDSIIYKICKLYDYPHLKLPNFDGKRRFVYDICDEIRGGTKELKKVYENVKVIFIDEVQDLEYQCFKIFQIFFGDCKIVFAGDIFQSIQKEPRESLLWYLLNNDISNTYKKYMRETPRVPKKILSTLKSTLTSNYPEFQDQIDTWVSSNKTSDVDISWNRFYSYNQIFKNVDEFCKKYNQKDVMVLTFSSAITVKGNMGDVARMRKFLEVNNYDINKDHKKMDPTKLFLSTANSSKGLERDYVLCVLTFPLELAFMNFSNDIVLNLITVAVTRAKKKVVFYIPAYKDKFSKVLDLFTKCPQPNKEKIRHSKQLSEYTFSDYMNVEHNVTSLIKQSIISYDTRIKLKEFVKSYDTQKIFMEPIDCKRPILSTEEDRALVGVLLENLITSCWMKYWPTLPTLKVIKNNPMYTHCIKKIEVLYKKYKKFSKSVKYGLCGIDVEVEGMIIYSQLHQAMFNKIFINISDTIKKCIITYWKCLKPKCMAFKPTDYDKIDIQSNLRMPHLTGIADVKFKKKTDKSDEINLWEIKASISNTWKDNALTQIILYSLMTGKSWSRLTLLNVFTNDKIFYHFNSKKIMWLRNLVIQDIMIYNTNCYLSKNYNIHNKLSFDIKDVLFVDISYHKDNTIKQFCVIDMKSPTKSFLVVNEYFKNKVDHNTRVDKLCSSSSTLSKDSIEYVNEFMSRSLYKDKRVWMMNKIDQRLMFKQSSIYEMIEEMDSKEMMDYKKNEELKFELDYEDVLTRNITKICKLSSSFKFF